MAAELKRLKIGDGSNDDLYHRTRRIVIAEAQNIVNIWRIVLEKLCMLYFTQAFGEWLLKLIGNKTAKEYNLDLDQVGTFSKLCRKKMLMNSLLRTSSRCQSTTRSWTRA